MKKLLSLILALVTLSSLFFTVNVSAASWPSLGAYSYCEITAPKKINVYTSMYLNKRGTSSPSKQYNAYIDKGDICKIYRIESNFIHLAYPTSSGYKQGFIKRSDMFGVSSPSETFTSNGKATTYKYAGSSSYGNTAKGDAIYKVGTSGSYTQIIYTAKSGSRAFKAGWVRTSDYNNVLKKTPIPDNTPSSTTTVAQKINSFINHSNYRNGASWAASKRPILSSYGSSGCAAYAADFAKYVFGKSSPRDGSAFYSASQIKSGDIIIVTNSQHWFVVLERNGNSLKTAEGNWGGKVVISDSVYTIVNGQLYRNGKKFRTFSAGYHFM